MDVIVKEELTDYEIGIGDIIKLDKYDNICLVCIDSGRYYLQSLSGVGMTGGNYTTVSEMLDNVANVLEVYKARDYQLVLERK